MGITERTDVVIIIRDGAMEILKKKKKIGRIRSLKGTSVRLCVSRSDAHAVIYFERLNFKIGLGRRTKRKIGQMLLTITSNERLLRG